MDLDRTSKDPVNLLVKLDRSTAILLEDLALTTGYSYAQLVTEGIHATVHLRILEITEGLGSGTSGADRKGHNNGLDG